MKFAPAEDRKGRTLEPGDKVRFKTYPRGEAEGVVIVSSRSMQVMLDGSTLPALAIEVEGGRTFGMPSSKGVLKITSEQTLKTEGYWKEKMKLREAIRKIIKEEIDESKNEDPSVIAAELGKLAFEQDKMRFPGGDKKLMDLVKKYSDGKVGNPNSIKIMKAWTKAWDQANLAAPVPGLDESDDNKYTYVVSAKVNGYLKTCTVMASSLADAKDKGAEKLGAGVDPSTVRAGKRDS